MILRTSPRLWACLGDRCFCLEFIAWEIGAKVSQSVFLRVSDGWEEERKSRWAVLPVISTQRHSHLEPRANYTCAVTADTYTASVSPEHMLVSPFEEMNHNFKHTSKLWLVLIDYKKRTIRQSGTPKQSFLSVLSPFSVTAPNFSSIHGVRWSLTKSP